MLTFHLGPLSRRARMFLQLAAGCLGMCVLIGPTLLALAGSPPITAATSWTPLRLLAVKPYRDLRAGSCMDDPAVHAGPMAVQGRVVGQSALDERLTAAVLACAADDWSGDVTISATVDAPGNITAVQLAGDTPPLMQRCLRSHVFHGQPLTMSGPGTLRASYFVDQRRTGRVSRLSGAP